MFMLFWSRAICLEGDSLDLILFLYWSVSFDIVLLWELGEFAVLILPFLTDTSFDLLEYSDITEFERIFEL